jgi:DNA polymerase-3 subunit delta
MIFKSYELNKINFSNYKIVLFYGENKGLIKEAVDKILLQSNCKNIFRYTENEILSNIEIFYNQVFTSSFFETKKILIVSQITNKFEETINSILEKKNEDTIIILIADKLDKKSKIRSLCEKNKKIICVPFYADDKRILNNLIREFFVKKQILISQSQINLILTRVFDRNQLNIELNKIEAFLSNKKKIKSDEILKLINLSENYSASELVDNYLAKNQKKIMEILNENNFNSEENLIVIRVFLNKLKRLQKLKLSSKNFNGDMERAISEFKPVIFWKEKDIIKQQLKSWSLNQLRSLFKDLNYLELIVKKNFSNSNLIINNFFLKLQ